MPADDPEERFRVCFKQWQDRFSTYDQAVDVISCLELFFEEGYAERLDHFERFPRDADSGFTPDATVLFENGYGLVIELKRTFPRDDTAFRREIDQLRSYDGGMAFQSSDGGSKVPDVMDIMLLIKFDNSNEIFRRFNTICEEEGIEFEHNLVFMEYNYDASNSVEKYVIRKWMGDNREFRDGLGDDGLEALLGVRGLPIIVPPAKAAERNLTRVFINDEPPEIYTVVFLWTRVLYNLLDGEQRERWRVAGPDRTLPIDLDVDELVRFVNDRIVERGMVRKRWMTRAMEFLRACGLATDLPDGRARVLYRNLRQMTGARKYASDGQQEFDRVRDLGAYFIDLYCRRLVEGRAVPEEEEATPDGPAEQRSLLEF